MFICLIRIHFLCFIIINFCYYLFHIVDMMGLEPTVSHRLRRQMLSLYGTRPVLHAHIQTSFIVLKFLGITAGTCEILTHSCLFVVWRGIEPLEIPYIPRIDGCQSPPLTICSNIPFPIYSLGDL